MKLTREFPSNYTMAQWQTADHADAQVVGELFAHFPRVDVSRLHRHADLEGLQVAQGRGAVRAWVDVQRGQIGGGTVDMALDEVNATLGKNLRPLALRTVTGPTIISSFRCSALGNSVIAGGCT